MKNKILNTLYYSVITVIMIPLGLVSTVYISDIFRSVPETREDRRIEYYMLNDIMYINIDQLEIEYESTDSVLKFDSFDSLAFYISEKTSKEHKR